MNDRLPTLMDDVDGDLDEIEAIAEAIYRRARAGYQSRQRGPWCLREVHPRCHNKRCGCSCHQEETR